MSTTTPTAGFIHGNWTKADTIAAAGDRHVLG
jgi:hypothetical protein